MDVKLEKMADFFDARLDEYDNHQLTCIESAKEFFQYTADLLPKGECSVLDLGCGTGLELEYYFSVNQNAKVTGIDIAPGMLKTLKNKFLDKDIKLVLGSYFDVAFELNFYDAVVSVESLHHFTKNKKIELYKKVFKALKENGYLVLTDYFSLTDEEEIMHRHSYEILKKEQGINDEEFYHYDTPLTVSHECEAIIEAGFSKVEILKKWGQTFTIRAFK